MRLGKWIMGVAAIAGGCVGLAAITSDADATGDRGAKRLECNNRLLKGNFGIQMQGTRPVPGVGGIESVIGVVTRTFDGSGNFTQVDNLKGSVSGFASDRPGFGTYQVDADCTGTTRFEPGPGVVVEEHFVVLDYGQEYRSITTAPQPIMVTTVARRIGIR